MGKITVIVLFITIQTAFSQKKWTVLGYFDGDQFFGDCGVTDVLNYLTEMDSMTNVNTVIQADRYENHPEYTWTDTRRFKIEHNDSVTDNYNFNEVCVDSTLGELNMGSMETLRDFLIWGVNTYPSERYILILKDHGGGWENGICIDETNGGDCLKIKEIRSALDELYTKTGVKIDILAFDACLMGMIETAYELKDYIQTSFVFSQDFGWAPQIINYTDIISGLDNDPDISSAEATDLFFRNVPLAATTLSAVSVSELTSLKDRISDFVDSFISAPDWDMIQTAFNYATKYGYRDSFMDIKLFFESLRDSGVANASEVIDGLDSLILANHTRDPLNRAEGLNIFFNHYFDGDIISYNSVSSQFAEDSKWKDFLDEYSSSYDTFNQFIWNSYENLLGYWTLIDNDGDYNSWQYRDWEVYIDTKEKLCDDYIVSPRINIGSKSIFKFKAKSLSGDKFLVKLSEAGNEDINDFKVILLDATYPSSDWTEYSVELNSFFNQDIYIAMQCVSNSGTELVLKDFELTATDNIYNENIVSRNELFNNYPNPFNPETTIRYALNSKQHVQIAIFNATGTKVAELVNEIEEAGIHDVNFDAKNLPSGEYFYKLETADNSIVKRMLLLK